MVFDEWEIIGLEKKFKIDLLKIHIFMSFKSLNWIQLHIRNMYAELIINWHLTKNFNYKLLAVKHLKYSLLIIDSIGFKSPNLSAIKLYKTF